VAQKRVSWEESMDDIRWCQKCSRFENCSVNRCPLDPIIDHRNTNKFDKFKKCKQRLKTRVLISREAMKFGIHLKYDGMNGHEYNAYNNTGLDPLE
jgi:flavoprotein